MTRSTMSPWQRSLPLVVALLGWLLFWYWDTAMAMVGIWIRSETYAHAFVVPPITLWLIWRQRHLLLSEQPRASLLLTIPIALATFAWLLGELTAVNALTQFALVATLVLTIVALLGIRVSKRLAFPLGFLFFSVPFGEFMMPKLMEWTAAFTVLALRGTGIPVYQEGLQFVIPSGSWSVVEACSGIRYIIASVTVGTLFAYLNYTSLRRRIIFIVFAALVPVVANWLRAYMIVMLGHLSGNELAVGVDHLIYGWVFFGVVILIMFMIGARWSEPEPDLTHAGGTTPALPADSSAKAWLTTFTISLIAAAGPLAFIAINQMDRAGPVSLVELSAPTGWNQGPAFANWKPGYAAPSAELQATYTQGDQSISLYVGYYRNQDFQRKLITSTNTLAASNDRVWSVISRGTTHPGSAGLPTEVIATELLGHENGHETRLRVWQWYWVDGRLTASGARAKFYTALSRLALRGDDSAVILLYAPTSVAASALPSFAAAIGPEIERLLEATRDKR